jgi:hypothetical protein
MTSLRTVPVFAETSSVGAPIQRHGQKRFGAVWTDTVTETAVKKRYASLLLCDASAVTPKSVVERNVMAL